MDLTEIKHMLLHALTEESVAAELDSAKSQQEVYAILKTLSYFTITMDDFRQGIAALQNEREELSEHLD